MRFLALFENDAPSKNLVGASVFADACCFPLLTFRVSAVLTVLELNDGVLQEIELCGQVLQFTLRSQQQKRRDDYRKRPVERILKKYVHFWHVCNYSLR